LDEWSLRIYSIANKFCYTNFMSYLWYFCAIKILVRYCTAAPNRLAVEWLRQSNVSWESENIERINETGNPTWRSTTLPANRKSWCSKSQMHRHVYLLTPFHWVPTPTFLYLSFARPTCRAPQEQPSTFFLHVSLSSLVRMHAPRRMYFSYFCS
jgi:hypothetical protein